MTLRSAAFASDALSQNAHGALPVGFVVNNHYSDTP